MINPITADEALEKACPLAIHASDRGAVRCLSVRCMAWSSRSKDNKGWCGMIPSPGVELFYDMEAADER